MILYFADRRMNILGSASTELPEGLTIIDDVKIDEVDTGVATFECSIAFDAETRESAEKYASVGNYLLRSYNGENGFFTIIDSELDTKAQEIRIYAEDAGLDLLNEICVAYEADKDYPITHYIEKFAYDSGFVIGINEASDLSRKLKWEGESTAAERLASVATQFDNCEISYSFEIKGLTVVKKYINIYKERGSETGVQLRLNKEVDRITEKKSIANLATALKVTGGTPESDTVADPKPITLDGYTYDDGDIFLEGTYLKSRSAHAIWSRYLAEDGDYTGHIMRTFTYDTTSQSELCNRAVAELKKISQVEVNYEAEVHELSEHIRIGDRVCIIDDAGEIYVSTRILKLEESATNESRKATFGEFLMKDSGIDADVARLAAQFAESAKSTTYALSIAKNAQTVASSAVTDAANAKAAADAAQETANTAQQSAEAAATAVSNAQAAADQAKQAAENAVTKATEAQQAAISAQQQASAAQEAAATAQSEAETAKTNAANAQTVASEAKTQAEAAATTAAAAKLDAENAQKDIDAIEKDLTTLSNTMTADYARKTDLTEAQTSLQTQISQNAASIETHASQITTIDETANSAKSQAEAAKSAADAAKTEAENASADALAAQQAADTAKANATAAQTTADQAATAASAAQTAADEADAKAQQAASDLATAQQNLANVTSRVDATEEDIAAAQAVVTAAQTAADTAKANAAAAQSTADTAKANAATAQTAADNAKAAADAAQTSADEAQAAADAAQADIDALAVRVTAAETSITQTSEQIKLLATKTEVAQTLGGYYTKEQADAAIDVKANEITSSVISQIEAVQIGGRNIIRNTAYDENGQYWSNIDTDASIIIDDYLGKHNAMLFEQSGNANYVWRGSVSNLIDGDFAEGDQYTLSGWAYVYSDIPADANIKVNVYGTGASGNVYLFDMALNSLETDKWVYFSATAQVPSNFSSGMIFPHIEKNGKFKLANLKLEKGNKATDWSPAPEDMASVSDVTELSTRVTQTEESITSQATSISGHETRISTIEQSASGIQVRLDNAEKVATNFLSYDSTDGLLIGNKSSGSWNGYRTQIKSDSFNILDNSGNMLASYGANDVYLGANNKNTVIHMCNDLGTISYDSSFGSINMQAINLSLISDSWESEYGGYSHSYIEVYGDSIRMFSEDPQDEYYTDRSGIMIDKENISINGQYTVTITSPSVSVQGNLGVDGSLFLNGQNFVESGTWTPKLICEGSGAVNPTYTHSYNGIAGSPIGRYTRIGNLVYVQCYLPALISAAGTGLAAISGLPYAGSGNMDSTLVNRGYINALNGSVSTLNPVLKVSSGGTTVGYRIPDGSGGYNWKVNTSTSPKGSLIQFAGVYRIG